MDKRINNRKSALGLGVRYFILIICLSAGNSLKAGSLFDTYFNEWISNVQYKKAVEHTFFTVMPYSELIYVGKDSAQYLIHKQADGKAFAVEKLFGANASELTRNLNNQFAGFVAWSLENKYSDLFWSYVNTPSILVKSGLVAFNKQKNDSVFNDLASGKLDFTCTDRNKYESHIYIITQDKKRDTLITLSIQAKLLDVTGGDQNSYSLYLADNVEHGKVQKAHGLVEKSSSIVPFRKGLVTNETQDLLVELTKDEQFARKIMLSWLNATFEKTLFSSNASVNLSIAARDTLKINVSEQPEEFCNLIKNNLSANGEIAAIGLLSVKESTINEKKMRFLLLMRQEQLNYEHVVRIDHTVQKINDLWVSNSVEILLMALNPPGKINN